MIRKSRAETEDAKQKVFTTKAKTLDGMYIDYVTVGDNKVLHQIREVGTMAGAVKRLEATGFTRTGRMGSLEWSDGYTDAHIHFGSLDDARASIARYIHEYSFLD